MLWTLVRKYTKPYLRLIALAVVLQLASTLATLYLPSLNARIIDEGVVQGDTAFIWRVGGLMLAVAFGQVVSAVLAVWCGSRVAMAAGRDIRTGVYQRVDSFSANDVSRFGAATLITRGTNDVQQVQLIILMGLNFMVMVPIMSIGGIIMAVQEDPGLSWLVWVSVPVLLIIVGLLVRLLMPLFTRMQGNIDSINGVMREQIMGIRVVRAFVREDHETARFTDANAVLTDTSVRIGRLFILMGPIITMVLHLATAAVLWFGGHRVDQGLVQVGSLTAFMQYLLQILVAVMMGTFMFMMFPRAVVCARRIGEVLDTSSSMMEPEEPVELEAPRGEVEFRGVSYAYPGAEVPVLDTLSFRVEAGTTTAIIGATGSGKSTLVNLLPRLQDATSGEVIIDGAPVTALSRTTITESVGFVPQRPYLFSGTVRSNLHFGAPDATDEEMWRALETAQAADFVREQGGLDYAISQGGTNVSGGQRQRLCIARALVSRPRVYVFDDSFSALDVATDARLRAALPNYTEGATMIIVAQRVSTITNADQILVLENGAIAARGTHEQLLTSSTTYQEIVNSQLSEENAV
ncbi:ABC transporter ATP-binding protein [Ancrocorticia populi]|uniref:ABC transporter ATP-binding protein n=1 Tax=Ancrocorticia populi TaxID=2175228 RepID=UPI002356305F|nr:ABC transporter ATP-binding protein [Ancrocorticia populi]